MTDKSRSNYDRWKPGIKLACMMNLKKLSSDPNYFDPGNWKYSSLTWHSIAEFLNKEYPDYPKRFTNINVKDRYDRVLKHHRVFERMANQLSGFIWNPATFSFDSNEDLIKQYVDGSRNDEVIASDINTARFLCKSGHIDLEYYHRYIHQIAQVEIRNDSVLNSTSYIEDAISKGILTVLTSKLNFKESPMDKKLELNLPGHSNNFQRPFHLLEQNSQLNHYIPPHYSHEIDFTNLIDQQQQNVSSFQEPTIKRRKTVPINITQPGILVENYYNDKSLNLSTGDAVLQIFKEFESMKLLVTEEIIQLRTNKVISFNDFKLLQDLQENNISFTRSAYKRLMDNEKILDLINVYLNKS